MISLGWVNHLSGSLTFGWGRVWCISVRPAVPPHSRTCHRLWGRRRMVRRAAAPEYSQYKRLTDNPRWQAIATPAATAMIKLTVAMHSKRGCFQRVPDAAHITVHCSSKLQVAIYQGIVARSVTW
jgi:hypothetical protein